MVTKVLKLLIVTFSVVIAVSVPILATLLDTYVVLEGEHGNLIGQNIAVQGEGDNRYVNVGYQNDLLSLMLDIPTDKTYEFWFYVKGNSSSTVTLYSADGTRLFETELTRNRQSWHWIELKKAKKLEPGRYYLALSNFTGQMQIDKVIVKTNIKSEKEQNSLLQESTAPSLPNENPWVKQGLNPFAALLQNGNEFVSTTSGILTISATDLVIPGRGGLDLTFSRYYNSKTYSEDTKNSSYN